MADHLGVALAGLAASGALALLAWVISLRLHDVSVVDPFWPFMIAGAGLAYSLSLPGPGARGWLVLALSWAWALRLGIHLAWRRLRPAA